MPATHRYILLEVLEDLHFEQLRAMFQQEWWTRGRDLDSIRRSVEASQVVVALADEGDGSLAGFLRVLTDFRYFAVILDVVVRDDLRGHGLGRALMDAVMSHPKLQQLAGIGLQCEPEMVPFYEKWGFSDAPGRSRQMKRVFERPKEQA